MRVLKITLKILLISSLLIITIFNCKKTNSFGGNQQNSIGINEVILNNELNNIKARWIINADGTTMNDTPAVDGTKITFVPFMAKVFIVEENAVEETIGGKTGKWVKVEWNGKAGWIFSGAVTQVRPFEEPELELNKDKAELIGNIWKNNTQILELKAENAFSKTAEKDGGEGTWSFDGKKLTLKYTTPAESITEYIVTELTGRNLIIKQIGGGEVETYWDDEKYTDMMTSFVPFSDNVKEFALADINASYFYGNWTGKDTSNITEVLTFKLNNVLENWQAEIKPFQSILGYYEDSKIEKSKWAYDQQTSILSFKRDGKDIKYKVSKAFDNSFVVEDLNNNNFESVFSRAE